LVDADIIAINIACQSSCPGQLSLVRGLTV